MASMIFVKKKEVLIVISTIKGTREDAAMLGRE